MTMTTEEREGLKAEIKAEIFQELVNELYLELSSKPVYQGSLTGYVDEHSISLKWRDQVISEITLPTPMPTE